MHGSSSTSNSSMICTTLHPAPVKYPQRRTRYIAVHILYDTCVVVSSTALIGVVPLSFSERLTHEEFHIAQPRHDFEGVCSRNPTNISVRHVALKNICTTKMSIPVCTTREFLIFGSSAGQKILNHKSNPSFNTVGWVVPALDMLYIHRTWTLV